jgi:hypothetical protein
MNILDKVITIKILKEKKKRFCPPHRLPHRFPFFTKKICDEECHIHKTFWRDSHHTPFCKLIRCKNFKAMMKAKKIYSKKR